MRGNKWWILAGASAEIMLVALEAAPAETNIGPAIERLGAKLGAPQQRLLGVERHLRQLCARSIRWRL